MPTTRHVARRVWWLASPFVSFASPLLKASQTLLSSPIVPTGPWLSRQQISVANMACSPSVGGAHGESLLTASRVPCSRTTGITQFCSKRPDEDNGPDVGQLRGRAPLGGRSGALGRRPAATCHRAVPGRGGPPAGRGARQRAAVGARAVPALPEVRP